MCYYNQLSKNPKYKANKKNGGNIPAVTDIRTRYVPIGCGNCKECRKQKSREWQVRLLEDIKTNTNAKFITFTFSNESIKKLTEEEYIYRKNKETGNKIKIPISILNGYDKDNMIATRAFRLFNERYRKIYKKALRHWLITELGHKGTENIHIHGIIWIENINNWLEELKKIEKIWQYGFTWKYKNEYGKKVNYVSPRTINYMMKYVTKIDSKHKEYKPAMLVSDGIGADFTKTLQAQQIKKESREYYKTSTGHELALPIYWKNKIYNEEEREKLWIKRLDKEERWVNGQKFDISKTTKAYENALQAARQKNTELGYGSRPNENRKEYEEQKREIMHQTRIKKASGGVFKRNLDIPE